MVTDPEALEIVDVPLLLFSSPSASAPVVEVIEIFPLEVAVMFDPYIATAIVRALFLFDESPVIVNVPVVVEILGVPLVPMNPNMVPKCQVTVESVFEAFVTPLIVSAPVVVARLACFSTKTPPP